MQALWASSLILSTLTAQAGGCAKIADFELRDSHGTVHKLSDWQGSKLVVVAFLGVDCPLAKLYGTRLAELAGEFAPRGVAFVGINPNQHDGPSELVRYARLHNLRFPLLKDPGHAIADRFGATRTPEVFILDEQRLIRYHGRIDDQYAPGIQRSKPSRRYLAVALEELLNGQTVSQPWTEVVGCSIDRVTPSAALGRVTYCRDIAPIVQKRCVVCHRSGQIAPFSLTTYEETVAWADTIREVVAEGRMPPWHANPKHGTFANDLRLTGREKQLIDAWAGNGAPEGDRAELPAPLPFATDWRIPTPDLVVSIPEPFTVPAEGIIEYQYFEVDPGFHEDTWIRAAEIRPGNRAVVHHCNVFLKPPGSGDPAVVGTLGSICLAAAVPSTPPMILPEGLAKRVPAGWRFLFVVHYTTVGSVQTDRTSLGLAFADPKTVKKEVATKLLLDEDLCIPPHVADHRIEKSHRFGEDVLLLALFPHMHLRGKSFRYEVVYPDGNTEILLDVPRYDFNWQHRYELAQPKRLPAGTTLRCTAHYDNSADNPLNPDPSATVRAGPQSWDEMFNGYFDVALAEQDLTRPKSIGDVVRAAFREPLRSVGMVVVAGGVLVLLRRWHKRVRHPIV